MDINIRNINNILNHIKSVKQGTHKKRGICFLIGAGADISSGGILFRELKIRFLKENDCIVPNNITDKLLDEQFEKQIEKMTQNSRCETLDTIMKKHKTPSEGYSLLVMLAELGYIDAVITTNFDYLLEETQRILNLSPFTIFTPGRAIPDEYYTQRDKISPLYLKMHGDILDRLVTHLTQNEIQNKEYGEKFVKLFKHIINNYSLIIVGYGGYDSLISHIFEEEVASIDEVYWCNVCEPKDDSELVQILKQKNKLSYVETSFDNLFQELSKSLLKEITFKNTPPIFLPTVVESKIENQITLFQRKIEYSDKIITRTKEQEMLEDFLATYENKCIAIIGEHKFGKSCFIYKVIQAMQDITFFPIMNDNKYGILENIAHALGYDADLPLPIIYSFMKWWNGTNKQLVFVIDDFFNAGFFEERELNQCKDFLNLLYITNDFRNIQFIICFQNSIYKELESTLTSFANFVSPQINIGKFSEEEVVTLLKQRGINDNLDQKELLCIPYIWDVFNKCKLEPTQNSNFWELYVDAIYNMSTTCHSFTKHAFNTILKKLAYRQIFDSSLTFNMNVHEYFYLQKQEIVSLSGEIVYPELAIYFCKLYILNTKSWETAASEFIFPYLQTGKELSDLQMEVYVSVLAEIDDINKYNILLNNLDNLIINFEMTSFLKKIVIKILQKCFKYNQKIFESYLQSVEINTYSIEFQYYLFKVCAELSPQLVTIWSKVNKDYRLSYASFLLTSDALYSSLNHISNDTYKKTKLSGYFKEQKGLLRLIHILTYFGWDNIISTEYIYLKDFFVNNIFRIVQNDTDTIQYSVSVLIRYAYNIFFNAGEDFEEQFACWQSMPVYEFAKKVLKKEALTEVEYLELLKLNSDINNSWLFIISNIVVVQSMKNKPQETYNMLFRLWDNIQFDAQVQHLDFFLSSVFWSLYLCEPNNREKFVAIFEKIANKYERKLFMFPETERKSSFLKFSEEFEKMFEDGFSPIAFYFYTAPYKSLTTCASWDNGKNDLKIYWEWAHYMSDLGKYDDILRIIHALGQMISIYPEKGYSALENIVEYDHPIIKKGIIRIFKENYLRYSKITKEEMRKNIYHFNVDDMAEIIYNSDFLLENRTLEQLHWGRLFYNLEHLLDINISEVFLTNALQANSCVAFLRHLLESICKKE